MKRLSHAESARQPSVTVFEDLHWLDPASELFLANHVEAIQGTRGLTVLNFRPEYHASWMSRSFYRQIALAPLGPRGDEADARRRCSAPTRRSTGLAELIRERTPAATPSSSRSWSRRWWRPGSLEGERGAYRLVRSVDEAALPATVQAVLAARIDRLAPARQGGAAGRRGRRQGVLRAGAGARRRALAGGARGRAAGPRRGRVRLRAGALSRRPCTPSSTR